MYCFLLLMENSKNTIWLLKNLGVDLVIAKGTSVKNNCARYSLFADWTPSNGYVFTCVMLMISFQYTKNLASTTKIAGNTVKSGEVLAILGMMPLKNVTLRTLENGIPIDPTQYINFQ